MSPATPHLPTQADVTPAHARQTLRAVRQFHLSGSSQTLQAPGDDVLPALLHRFRNPDQLRSEYPLLLFPPDSERAALPIGDWLRQAAEDKASALEDARLLTDNIPRIELSTRRRLDSVEHTDDPSTMLNDLAAKVASDLSLSEQHAAKLTADLRRLTDTLPHGTSCIALGRHTAVHLAIHIAIRRLHRHRRAYTDRARKVRDDLHRLLDTDDLRRGQGDPSLLSSSLGEKSAGIDPAALARVAGRRQGASRVDDDRRRRIQSAIEKLDAYLENPEIDQTTLIHAGQLDDLDNLPSAVSLQSNPLPCAEATRLYDEAADRFAPFAVALRVGELELDNAFDPTVYAPLVESFDADSLSPAEQQLIPPVIAIETVERLTGPDMPNITRALLSGRPIRILLAVEPAANLIPHTDHDPLDGFHFEPGAFGLGLRQAIVHQSAASRPDHLLSGLERSLDSSRPSLHVIATGTCEGGHTPPVGPSLHVGAALEGRAHALFLYDPQAGRSWAARLDFAGNEQPESDWPTHELECIDAGGGNHSINLGFTFVDFALLEPAYRDHFRIIPDDCSTTDLAPVHEYPFDDTQSAGRRIPFIWAVDADARALRLAVSRQLLDACRDRLSHWRTLQELAGIHNEYVDRAVAQERQSLGAESDRQIADLRATHAEELEAARREAAGEALGKLAEMLLDVDISQVAARAATPKGPAPAAEPAPPPGATDEPQAAEASPPAVEEEEEDLVLDEPYIDSVLCTSCNDCLNINPQLFVYNANKQATIGDPDAGTFQQLVVAAEKCPARCIHPGKPRNPDEPNLDDLIERAKPFN